MPKHIGHGFLNDPENGGFELGAEARKILRPNYERGGDPAALGDSLEVPAQCGDQADFIEQRRMEKVRHGTHLLNRAIDALAGFRCGLLFAFGEITLQKAVHDHFRGRQLLAEAVVKFAGDAPPFFILKPHQPIRELPESVRFLFDQLGKGGGIFANRLFEELAVMNIGGGPVPARDSTFLRPNRDGTSTEPAILPAADRMRYSAS